MGEMARVRWPVHNCCVSASILSYSNDNICNMLLFKAILSFCLLFIQFLFLNPLELTNLCCCVPDSPYNIDLDSD